jgi:hypothetical protein
MNEMSPPAGRVPNRVVRLAAGDRGAVVELLEGSRGRLGTMVAVRLDPGLQGRVDASDVIQEGYLDAMRIEARTAPASSGNSISQPKSPLTS